MNIFVILMILFIGAFLYFGALRKVIKLFRCREKVTGVIVGYKFRATSKDYSGERGDYRPICNYTYEGVKYSEVVDYIISMDKYETGDELEFNISASNPKLAVKTDIIEIIRMVVYIIVACFMGVCLASSIGETKIDLEEIGLKLLGAFFVGAYLYNLLSYVILPIKEKVFSKGMFDIIMWLYMTIAILTVGTIFLVIGIAYMSGPEKTTELYKFIKRIWDGGISTIWERSMN